MMKRFAVLVAALALACPAVITSSVVYADEIVITPGQWDSATAPAAPGNWRHVGTSGDTGEPAPEGQAKKAVPAKEKKEAAPAGKETKETTPTKEKKEAAPAKEAKETSPAAQTQEAPQESKAPEYRIFNLNLPAPPEEAKPQPQPAPVQSQPAPAPGYIEKGGMIIPSTAPGPPGRQVTVTPGS